MKEESILESFKQYHNANWHDGDNTFDERTYARSNNEDFDDLFVQDCFEHYEAGYHSGYEKACKEPQVFATSNLTWKDIAFRALSCKVPKSTENWVHVKNIACVGSTTASLICKNLGVNPDDTKFELIEAKE